MERILIVDDEASILEGLSNAIRKLCHFHGEITTVETGREAIREAILRRYNICFLDIELPDLNGLGVLKTIHKVSPETKVAMISASRLDDEMTRTIEESGALFISKPFVIEDVKAFLKNAFRESEE